MIYDRAVSSLMSKAKVLDEKVIIDNNGYAFELNGEKILFDGYLKVFNKYETEDTKALPDFIIGDVLKNPTLEKEQKFTNPPLRYSEARLIRKMEELGIGRPSTYAVTMDTLKQRGYVKVEKKTFIPTDQGILTSDKLDEYFNKVINIKYTADMEEALDKISEGEIIWYEELEKFYNDFKPLLDFASDNMVRMYPIMTDELCPDCGNQLLIRNGRFGEFIACSNFPKCHYTAKKEIPEPPVYTDVKCPNCEHGMIVERISKRGRSKGQKFYACDQYPTCKSTYTSLDEVPKVE
jgi:DNA topoisomerase-1